MIDKYNFDETLKRIVYLENVLKLDAIPKSIKVDALIELQEIKVYLFSLL